MDVVALQQAAAQAKRLYLSVGQTNVDVDGRYGGDPVAAIAAEGAGKRYWLTRPTYNITSPILLGTGSRLTGSGRGSVRLVRAADGIDVVTNADYTNGNDHVTIEGLTIDGDKPNRALSDTTYLLHLERCAYFSLFDIEVMNAYGPGAFLTGNGVTTVGGQIRNFWATGNWRYGLWTGFQMRRTNYAGITAMNNGQTGYVLDHSEATVTGVHAYNNGIYGIWVRNVFGNNMTGFTANRNTQHGIFAEGLLSSIGSGWSAHNNGVGGAGYSDLYLSGTNSAGGGGYGPTKNTIISGVQAGWETLYGAAVSEDYAVYIDDGPPSIRMPGRRVTKGSLGGVRLPANYVLLGERS